MKVGFGIILFIIWSSLAVLSPAGAAVHEGRNVLGLSTEADHTGHFQVVDRPLGTIKLHLVVYGYDHPQGVVAWDCALHLPRGMAVAETRLMGGGTNHHIQPGNFRVTTQWPILAQDGLVHLATVDILILEDADMGIGLGPDPLWGDDGTMGFARQTYETIREPLHWPRGCAECPVFELTHSQADEWNSWDRFKSLYRP